MSGATPFSRVASPTKAVPPLKRLSDQSLSEIEFVRGHARAFGPNEKSPVKISLHETAQANFVFGSLIRHKTHGPARG